jgi:hypothetical protein
MRKKISYVTHKILEKKASSALSGAGTDRMKKILDNC